MRYAIGIDLGGTNIAAGIVTEDYKLLEKGSVPTKAQRPAAVAAVRVLCTRGCAFAHGFENIEPCKTAAGAVLLRPLCGVMV